MSDAVNYEFIICASCDYRFPLSEEVGAICGTPAPAVESVPAPSTVPDEFTGADHQTGMSNSNSQQLPPKPGFRGLVPIIAVSMVLMVFAAFFHQARKGKPPEASRPSAEVTSTVGQPRLESAAALRRVAENSAGGVQHLIEAKPRSTQATDSAKENDPAELWKAVKRGSVSAEVTLAELYLQGEEVSQNCEQAHLLLLGASKKGSKIAETILASIYAEQCQ